MRMVRRSARAVQAVRTFARVCMYDGRHVQPERCTYRHEYAYACVYGARHARTEYLSHRSARVYACTVFGVCLLSGAPIVCSLRGVPIARERCGTSIPYMYVYSVRHGPPVHFLYTSPRV